MQSWNLMGGLINWRASNKPLDEGEIEDEPIFYDPEEQNYSIPTPQIRSKGNDGWLDAIVDKLGLQGERSLKSTIRKVQNKLRQVDEDAYSPRIVSIGPLHSSTTTRSFIRQTSVRKHDHLRAMQNDKRRYMLPLVQQPNKKYDQLLDMEDHKWWYMLQLLNRTSTREKVLVQCGQAILEAEKEVRQCYAKNIKLEPNELAEVMLLDGCFMLELFLRSWHKKDSTEEDPIFQDVSMVSNLRHDLALFENQIPFFILKLLFTNIVRDFPEYLPCSIIDLALSFFYPDLRNQETIRNKCSQDGTYSHLLDLLHKFYLPACPEMDSKRGESLGFKLCVTKLLQAGIEFKKGEKHHLLDISFNKDEGVVTIPPLNIDETTMSLFMNLIAFEQCGSASTHHITSYAILMKSLMSSWADVELLQQREIITNARGGVENVLSLFDNILREVIPRDFCFSALCKEVNEDQKFSLAWNRQKAIWKVRWRAYIATTKKNWLKYMMDLKNDYFSNPWRVLSVIAAVMLLVLTGIQTYYTVRPFMHLP